MNKLIIFILFLSTSLYSQNIATFSDYHKAFFVFDDGVSRCLEHQSVSSYKTGDKCIGYHTNGNHLKVYYNHIDYDVSPMVKSYEVTNNLVSYVVGSQLYVFDNGKKSVLTKFVGNHKTGDSIVGFYNAENHFLQAYYKNEIITLADGSLADDSVYFLLGDNMLAFIGITYMFKVFYRNNIYDIMQSDEAVDAKIGRNVMAFIDPLNDYFQVFYKGEILELEPFLPLSYQVGYEKVAYVDHMETFKLFDHGKIHTVSDFPPDYYILEEDMLVYHMQGQLWMYYMGENMLVENYIPDTYKFKFTNLAYIDQNGYLNLFNNGNRSVLSYEKINSYEVYKNVVVFNQGLNTTKIFYNDKFYTK